MAHVANRIGFGQYVTRSQLEQTTLLSTRNSPAHIYRGNLAMFRWDATGAMGNVEPPLLVLSGAMDIVTRPEGGEAIAMAHPNAQYSLIKGVNHMGPLERADIYNDAVLSFSRLSQTAP